MDNGSITHSFNGNGEFVFTYKDKGGNTGSTTPKVTWIKEKQKATVPGNDTSPVIGNNTLSEHVWDKGKVVVEATYNKTGLKVYTCTDCGETKSQVLQRLIPANAASSGSSVKDGFTYAITSKKNQTVKVVSTEKTGAITIASTVTIDRVAYKATAIVANAFKENNSITSVAIGSNIKTIGKNTFYNCKKLKTVTFKGKKLTGIGDSSFYGCNTLTKITVPDTVTTIGKGAFSDCTALKTVIIGKNVKTIGTKAFYGDKKLTTLTFKGKNITKIGSKAFNSIPDKQVTVKAIASKIRAYKIRLINAGLKAKGYKKIK